MSDNVVKVFFSQEQQDLVGTVHLIAEGAEEETIIAIGYVAQCDDGSYEMSWAGDVSHSSMIEALKVLIRQLRKDLRNLEEKA